jgi:hypothetical protein
MISYYAYIALGCAASITLALCSTKLGEMIGTPL